MSTRTTTICPNLNSLPRRKLLKMTAIKSHNCETTDCFRWVSLRFVLVLFMAIASLVTHVDARSEQVQSPQMKTIATMGSGNGGVVVAGNNKQPVDIPQASSREIEKQIVDRILGEGYDKRIRPAGSGPHNASRPGK